MKRPDLDTLTCVNPECQRFRHPGVGNLVIRKVYGHDHIRLLRCRTCGEEFSERRGTALFNTKMAEATAEDVINVGRLKRTLAICGSIRPWLRTVNW